MIMSCTQQPLALIFTWHTCKTVWLHLKIKYNYTKIKNLKMSKSVQSQSSELEKGIPYGLPSIFLFRHALIPRSHQFGTTVDTCGSSLVRWGKEATLMSLKITAYRSGWPGLGQSLILLLGQICHLRPCLPQHAPARCVGWWWCSFPFFHRDHLYFQIILSLRVVRCWFLNGDWDGEQEGCYQCLCLFRAIVAAWWCEGVALVWMLAPDFW